MSNIPAGAGALLGQRLGNYEIVALLALGGTAEIYLAKVAGHAGFEKYVVVKCLHDHLADDEEFVKMFLDEARLAANLNHSNIAQTTALGNYGNRYYMVMEYLTGLSLAMVVRRGSERMPNGVLPINLSLNIVQQASAGLHYAHEHKQNGQALNIVHRDISPQNLVLTFEGVVKVVDFGIAKAELRETQTKSGTIKGKFAYMSPEQCIAQGVDRRTDVFALGIILHELLTGKRLFKRPNPYDTYQAVIDCKVLPPSKLNHGLDPAIDAIVMQALAKDKEDRFETAEALGDALLRFMHSKALSGGPGEIATFFDKHFAPEINEHNQRMHELIATDGSSYGDEPSEPAVAEQVVAEPERAARTKPPTAPPPAAIPSVMGANKRATTAAPTSGAIPSLAKKPAAVIPHIAARPAVALARENSVTPKPASAVARSEPIEELVTGDLVIEEKSERSSRSELSQFVNDLKPAARAMSSVPLAPAVVAAKSKVEEVWDEVESDPDDMPQEATRIEANPHALLASLEAAGLPLPPSQDSEVARPSQARFPDVANLATQIAPEVAASAVPTFGQRAPSSAFGPTAIAPAVVPDVAPYPAVANQVQPVAMNPYPVAGAAPYPPAPYPQPNYGYPPGATPPPQHGADPTNQAAQQWVQQNWSPEGTGPSAPISSALGQPLSGQFQVAGAPGDQWAAAPGQMPYPAHIMSPVGENYPQAVDWQAAANMRARAIPRWILVLIFLVTFAVALAITVAIRKALA
jgi:eukaryotic-like serine/threonine-protein kinase